MAQRLARAIGALLLLTVFALGACGGNDKTLTLSSVGEATAEAKTARVVFDVVFDGSSVRMEGEFDFGADHSRMTMQSSQAGTPSAAFVYNDDESYFGPIDPPASGPRCVHLAADAESGTMRDSFDPARILEDLNATGAELTKTGEGSVHDEPTTVYSFHITGEGDKENDFNAYGESDGTVEVGKDGGLRRLVLTPARPTPADKFGEVDEPAPQKLTMELWDYGVDVDLSVDKSRVVESGDPGAKGLIEQVFGASIDG